ncbi:hypothetical protein AGMMS49928_01950 [Spirochaetia bacterium]|nr:hypothetical protein AGMMS49928_01950 [Spirochaetia bacterium]
MLSLSQAFIYSAVMALAIFFCRSFPFLFFRDKPETAPAERRRKEAFSSFVEKVVPRAAMTVLAAASLMNPVKESLSETFPPDILPTAIPLIIAGAFTAIIHILKRNSLVSIFGGTALYMALIRLL